MKTWLPVNADYPTRNVAAQLADPRSMLNFTRTLLKLRRESPALHGGKHTSLNGTPSDVYAYLRESGDQRFVIAINFSGEPREFVLNEANGGSIHLSTLMDRTDEAISNGKVSLRPHESVLIRL